MSSARLQHPEAFSCGAFQAPFMRSAAAPSAPRPVGRTALTRATRAEALELGSVEQVKKRIRLELDDVARKRALQGYEIPRDFVVEREPFSKANHLITDSGKPATGRMKNMCAAAAAPPGPPCMPCNQRPAPRDRPCSAALFRPWPGPQALCCVPRSVSCCNAAPCPANAAWLGSGRIGLYQP